MIDPAAITTIRVGQLAEAPINLTDNFVHEIGTDLFRGTIGDLSTFIAGVISSTGGLAFLPITVVDDQILPVTTTNEWFLAGKGTYHQSGGFPDIVCTEELNVIIGNGTNWSLGVAIPIIIDSSALMISQTIRTGVLNYSPSEDAVFLALQAFLTNVASKRYAGSGQTYTLPSARAVAFKGWINDGVQHLEQAGFETDLNTFIQTGLVITFKETIEIGDRIIIDYTI